MDKFAGVLLASDFDDTLYCDEGGVPSANLEALGYFLREGGRFTVATGRAKRTFAPHFHDVPINAPVILSNGALLYDFAAGRTVVDLPLPPQAAEDLTALADAFPSLGVEVYHGSDVYIHHPNAYTHRHVLRVNTTWTPMDLADMPQPWSKAVIQADHAVLLEAQAWMKTRWPERYEVIFSNAVLLECTARHATKGGMVLRLAEMLGVRRENLYCVGDNQNDLSMLAVSAVPFAPANCARELKDWGATLLRPCQENAVAQLVDILDSRYSGRFQS